MTTLLDKAVLFAFVAAAFLRDKPTSDGCARPASCQLVVPASPRPPMVGTAAIGATVLGAKTVGTTVTPFLDTMRVDQEPVCAANYSSSGFGENPRTDDTRLVADVGIGKLRIRLVFRDFVATFVGRVRGKTYGRSSATKTCPDGPRECPTGGPIEDVNLEETFRDRG